MIWILMFSGGAIASLLGSIYMANSIAKFKFIKNRIIAFLIIIALFGVATYTLGYINAMTITVYSTAFFLLSGFITRIIKKYMSINTNTNLQGWLGIISSALFLGISCYLCVSVAEKDYSLSSPKDINNLRIAFITDSHLGTTFDGEGFAEHLKSIEAQNPDILLIIGDFVDDDSNKKDLETACQALGQMNLKYGVWFAYGNHDRGYFDKRDFSPYDLEQALLTNGIHILEDNSVLIDDRFYLVGRADKGTIPYRANIDELLTGLDNDKYIVVMDHEPADYDAEADSNADLVLCGHTHGGQMIPITKFGVWSGIDDSTYGLEHHNDTDFIVSSGISDWEMLFKSGTRSEYVIVDINAEK